LKKSQKSHTVMSEELDGAPAGDAPPAPTLFSAQFETQEETETAGAPASFADETAANAAKEEQGDFTSEESSDPTPSVKMEETMMEEVPEKQWEESSELAADAAAVRAERTTKQEEPPTPAASLEEEELTTAQEEVFMKNEEKSFPEEEEEIEESTNMDVESAENDLGDAEVAIAESPDYPEDGEVLQEDSKPETSKAELPYSTRGRSTGTDKESEGDKWERSSREALEEIGRTKEPAPPVLGASFLEALSEEERRTRTRFLPDVEGMHMLRKNEIKGDLALARSIASGSSISSLASSKKNKGKRVRSDDEMELEEDESTPASEDDRGSDIVKLGTTTLEFGSRDLILPSRAFIAPPASQNGSSSNGDISEGRGTTSASKNQNEVVSPFIVESVTAFNPPRPPESIGAKKKHRMLRWERRPEDVEVDLSNYRKTVQRTRQELHKAENEQLRLETIDAQMRRHFLGHLNALNEEYFKLNDEMGSIQQECVTAADLLTSRTRSRGAGKGSHVMRDVISVLKTRRAGTREKGVDEVPQPIATPPASETCGIGGLGGSSFIDWDQSTSLSFSEPAYAWVLPDDEVETPYGTGKVIGVEPMRFASSNSEPTASEQSSGGDADASKQNGGKHGVLAADKRKKDEAQPKSVMKGSESDIASQLGSMLPPRVSVRLPYGIGYFPIAALNSKENPVLYSDTQLAKRWKSMVETALQVGPCLDLEGMTSTANTVRGNTSDPIEPENEDQMDADEVSQNSEGAPLEENSATAGANEQIRKFLPFGAGMLPTATGRGSLLYDISIRDIEFEANSAFFEGEGVLGKVG
jgi:hypothetical protein